MKKHTISFPSLQHFPQFADDAAVLAAAGRYAIDKGVRRGAQVAVVVSEEAIKSTPMYHGDEAVEYYAGRGLHIYSNTGKVSRHYHVGGTKNASFPYVQFYSETAQIGAGVDFLLADSLEANPFQRSPEEARVLTRYLRDRIEELDYGDLILEDE